MLKTIRKVFSFFTTQEKKKIALIFIAIFGMGLTEMVGVATILPFLAIVTNPEIVYTQPYLSTLYQLLHISDIRLFMLFLGGSVFFTLVIGNLFSAFTNRTIICFCFNHGKKISCALFKKYLSQHYIYFIDKHMSHLANNILSEVDKLVAGTFLSSFYIMTKMTMMIGIFSLLLIVEPMLALTTVFILGGSYFFIYTFLRKRLSQAGQIAARENAYRYRLVNEVLGSVKELKILGREQTFLEQYAQSTSKYIKSEILNQLSPSLSRYIIEAIAFGGMILIALFLISTQENISKFMPLLGLYALAGYRLLPAMQQFFTNLSCLRFNLASLDIIFEEMKLPNVVFSQTKNKLEFKQLLKLKGISYRYPNSNKSNLSHIDFSIPLHSTVGIVGASGAGKTTLIDIILGLLDPSSGKLIVDDIEITKENLQAWQSNIGYVPQNIALIDASIMQNIALGISVHEINREAVIYAAKLANLHEFITQELPQGYDTAIGEKGIRLSGGQRQRIGIARALYHDPELLIFDEATSALDGATEKIIMEAIKYLAHRKTVILIAHRLNTVKDCDIIYVLDNGKIVGRGTYRTLIEENKVFQYLAKAYTEI